MALAHDAETLPSRERPRLLLVALGDRLSRTLIEVTARFGARAEAVTAEQAGGRVLSFRPHVLVATEADYEAARHGFEQLAEQVGAKIVLFARDAPDPHRIRAMIADALADAP